MDTNQTTAKEANIIATLAEALDNAKPAALVTIVSTSGSAPGKTGAQMVVLSDGKTIGTVGGGSLEYKLSQEATLCIVSGTSKEVSCDLQRDTDPGMICGGSLRAFIKVFQAPCQLVIVGAGHIGHELYKIGLLQGFQVVVVDNRPEQATKERFPDAKRIIAEDIPASLKEYHLHSDCYVTIATSSHDLDRLVLEAVIDSGAAYIGMIGSSKKIREIFAYLLSEGISREKLAQVFAPMGLNIASIRPAEIALAIIGEILLVKNNGSGDHMRATKKNLLPE